MVKNSDIFYQEVRNNTQQVQENIQADNGIVSILVNSCSSLLWLADTAVKEGLLALGEAKDREKVTGLVNGMELARMIDLVCDGTEPEVIEDMCMKRYFSWNYSKIEGFLYLVYMDVMLDIQNGVNFFRIRESIKSFMPFEVNRELDRMAAEEEKKNKQISESSWKKLYGRTFPIQPEASEYYIIRIVDYCIISMSDKEVQRLLRDIETQRCVLLMKGLSGDALKKLHDNLSERLCAMLLEDMEYMGPVRLIDVADAANKVFQVMLKLAGMGEISVPGKFAEIFVVCNVADVQKTEFLDLKK